MGAPGYAQPFTQVRLLPNRLGDPRRSSKPTTFFVNSMSDLFHSDVPESFIDRVFDVMRDCPQHTFQVLTKRAERLMEYSMERHVPANVWLGVSVENRKHGVPRIDQLRGARAQTRFLSIEPLLEDLGHINLSGISWVIVGGESGRGARPMRPEWVRRIRAECSQQAVPFFFKQWGAYGSEGVRGSKKANGRELDGQVWDEMPLPLAI
jgi:protein gp37